MKKDYASWQQEVLRYVRFRLDHKAIAKELYAHYEDHVKDLERIGYEEDLARERALTAMGDPAEVGKGLDQAHKPWLGWLWQATRWCIVGAALVLAITLVFAEGASSLWDRAMGQLKWQDPPAYADRVETELGTIYAAPGKVWKEDGHTYLYLNFWIAYDSPATDGLTWSCQITTDQGEISLRQRDENGNWQESGYYDLSGDADFWIRESFTRYQWSVCFVVDEPLKWAEVRHPFQDWVLRAEWEVE